MNRIYKTRFNRRLGVWQVVPETARGGGKSQARTLATTVVLVGAALASAAPAQAQQWIGGSGNWFTGTNWDAGTPPDGGADAIIRNGSTVQLQAGGAAARGIIVRLNSTLEVSGPGHLTAFFLGIGDPAGGGTLGITGGGQVRTTSSSSWLIDDGSTLLVDGAGSLAETSFGAPVSVGKNGAASATVSNGGVLRTGFGSVELGSNTGTGTLNIGNGAGAGIVDALRVWGGAGSATVNFNHTDTDYFFTRDGTSTGQAVAITDSVAVNAIGGGTTTLTGNNTYSGGTSIGAGTTVRVGNGGAAGSIGTGAIANDGTLVFNRSDQFTVGQDISGAGRLVQAGTGTLVLTGTNSYSGGTRIDHGEIRIDSNAGLGTGEVLLNGGRLRTDTSMTLYNIFRFVAGTTSNVTAAAGTTLTAASIDYQAGAEASFGTGGVDSTVVLGAGYLVHSSGRLRVAGGTLTGNFNALMANLRSVTVDGGATLDLSLDPSGGGGIKELLGSGDVRTSNSPGGQLTISQGSFGGVISGAAMLYKDSGAFSNTLVLTGDNSYTGGTIIASGTLQVGAGGNAGALGSGDILIEDGALLDFNRTGTSAIADDIGTTTSGHLRMRGGGTLVLSGDNSYTDTLIGAGSVIQVGAGGMTGTLGTGTVTNHGTLDFNRGGTLDVTNTITGTGAVRQLGPGLLVLSGNNGYSGGTAVRGGTLLVSADNNLGAASGVLVLDGGRLQTTGAFGTTRAVTLAGNGTFQVDAPALTLGGAVGGTGNLVKEGTGTLVLGADNNYAGTTVVLSGTLQVGDGGTTGSPGSGDIINHAVLAFNRSDTVSLANAISGTGSLTQAGPGNLVLTGANTYTGGTFVNAGTLSVNGSIVGDTTVNSGGALGGSGTVGNVAIASGGTLAPGNSIGTLTVNGNLGFAPGSIYRVEANAAGEADRVNTVGAGTITINGGTVDVQAGGAGYQRNTKYTILRSGGTTTGRFDNATTNLAFLTPTLIYEADGVLLNLEASNIAEYATAARTPNQTAVANYLQSFANTPSNEQAAGLIQQLDNLTADQAAAAFESMAGSAHASASQVASALGRNFSATLAARSGFSTGGLGNAMNDWSRTHYASLAPIEMPSASGGERGMWVQALGAGGNLDTDGNAAGSRYRSNGIVLGYDQPVTGQWLAGGAFGYSTSWWNSTSGDSASGRIESPQAGLYARYAGDSVRVRIDGTFARHDFTTNRTVRVGATSANTNATHKGNEWGLAGQVEMPIQAGNWELRPLAGVRYAQLNEDGFSETGQGPANLSVAERTSQNTLFSAGMHFVRMFNQGKGGVELRAVASHLAGDNDSPVTASIAGQAGSFTATGVPLKRNALTLGTTVSGQFTRDVSAYLDANYEVRGSGQDAYRLTAGVRVAF